MLSLPGKTLIFDSETTGLWPWPSLLRAKHGIWPDRPFLFICTNLEGETISFRAEVDPRTRKVDYRSVKAELRWLRSVLDNPEMRTVCHIARFDRAMTIQPEIRATWRCKIHDTRIMARVINPTGEVNYSLKPLAKKYLGIDDDDLRTLKQKLTSARLLARNKGWAIATKELHGKRPAEADYWLPELRKLSRIYGELDGLRTVGLYRFYRSLFDRNKKFGGRLWEIYRWELRTMRTAMAMEQIGMTYYSQASRTLKKFYTDYMTEHQAVINRMGYRKLNPRSSKQMIQVFVDKLGYKVEKFSKKTGAPKIDGEQLLVWARGAETETDSGEYMPGGCVLSQHILEWKAGSKAVESLNSYEKFKCRRDDGSFVLHPLWDSAGARTGRFSCQDPNIQNIASIIANRPHSKIRGRQRECYGPRPRYVWYMPDYSQIEVWVFAFEANEESMKSALLSGSDFHLATAKAAWSGRSDFCTCGRWKEVEQEYRRNKKLVVIWSDEKTHHPDTCFIRWWRQRAKLILFSSFYGAGLEKTASLIRCTVKEAQSFRSDFHANLPGVKDYMDRVIDQVRDTGTLVNLFGREYPIDKRFAYKAVNYKIQGSAAEIMKRGIVRVNDHLLDGYPGEWTTDSTGDAEYQGSHVIATVHDELIAEIHPDDHSKQLMREILALMQVDSHVIPNLPIPLPVKMEWTKGNWNDSTEIHV